MAAAAVAAAVDQSGVFRGLQRTNSMPASAFAREGVHALAGIGHPARFFAQLAAMGIAATPHPFPDHHRFVPGDLAIADAQAILMTEKDALKCETLADDRCWYLPVRARIDEVIAPLAAETETQVVEAEAGQFAAWGLCTGDVVEVRR